MLVLGGGPQPHKTPSERVGQRRRTGKHVGEGWREQIRNSLCKGPGVGGDVVPLKRIGWGADHTGPWQRLWTLFSGGKGSRGRVLGRGEMQLDLREEQQ